MYKFSKTSRERLKTCSVDLRILFNKIIMHHDCTIVEGFRNEIDQNRYFSENKSQLKWPNSKHNKLPCTAIDVLPYLNGRMANGDEPGDIDNMIYFAGYVMGYAEAMRQSGEITHKIRCGIDWNMDNNLNESFRDIPHFEEI